VTGPDINDYGELIEPATLRIRRLLPGPVERIWAYLTDTELRQQWFAAGMMDLTVDAPFELIWRNGDLSEVTSQRPEGVATEARMKSKILAVRAPTLLAFSWGESGEVHIELATQGEDVLLTLVHRRVAPDQRLNVSAGWHMHFNILESRMRSQPPQPFWEGWLRLKAEYAARFQAM
jgi:uncharacterized protein YndB with AHSA1/START domain